MKTRGDEGFTLMEMVVAVFVVSIMSAVVVPHLIGISGQADQVACAQNQQAIKSAVTEYYLMNHEVPTGDSETQLHELVDAGLLQTVPVDPSGGEYTIDDSNPEKITVTCSVHGELDGGGTAG